MDFSRAFLRSLDRISSSLTCHSGFRAAMELGFRRTSNPKIWPEPSFPVVILKVRSSRLSTFASGRLTENPSGDAPGGKETVATAESIPALRP